MTRDEVLNSIALKKRFAKDNNLPITVFDNPYFLERLYTINIVSDAEDKFNQFCRDMELFKSEEDYFQYYNELKDEVINDIKSKKAFADFQLVPIDVVTPFTKKNLYIEENDGKCFISIDMKKANFSALRHFSNEIFNGCSTWEDYLKHYTGITSILKSKYIRQVILGACNPGRQIKYEHYLMAILANHIKFSLPDVSVYSLGEDEIILEYDYKDYEKAKRDLQMFNNVASNGPQGVGDLVRITFFRLHQFSYGWYKEDLLDENAEPEFKCVDAEIYHQVVKHFFGRKITNNDLVFYHNGRLARFLEAIENPWKK